MFEEEKNNNPDSFLEKRHSFAEDVGFPNLYDYIDHFGLFAGVHTIGNKLWTYELLKQTVGVPGDIFEFGCWNGANLMFLAKIHSLLEPSSPKRVFGFDNFSGLPEGSVEDGDFGRSQGGNYLGNESLLRKSIELFDLKSKIKLVVGDALETIPVFNKKYPETICSFVYLDFDLYEPTKEALKMMDRSISVGGIIVFDEACTPSWPGETLAMKEYLSSSEHKFEMLSNPIGRQPTVAIKLVG